MKYKNKKRMQEGFSITEDSKYSKEKASASNTISILNAANIISFENRDFNGCETPYAIFSDQFWHDSTFEYANLF